MIVAFAHVQRNGYPEVMGTPPELKTGRHYPDDCVRNRVYADGPAEHLRIPSQVLLPQAVADYSGARSISGPFQAILVRQKCAPEYRLDAQGTKEIRSYPSAAHLPRPISPDDHERGGHPRSQIGKRFRLRTPVHEIRGRDVAEGALRVVAPHEHEGFRIGVAHGMQHEPVHYAEHRRTRADTERQDQDD